MRGGGPRGEAIASALRTLKTLEEFPQVCAQAVEKVFGPNTKTVELDGGHVRVRIVKDEPDDQGRYAWFELAF